MTDLELQEIIAAGRAAILAGLAARRVAAVEAERQALEDELAGGAEGWCAASDAVGEILDIGIALATGSASWLEVLVGVVWAGERAVEALNCGGEWLNEQVRP
jgi:hypothetical protein